MTEHPASRSNAAVPQYGPAARWLHWLVAVLLVGQFVVSYLMPDIGPRTPPGTLINLHLSLGLTLIVLMAARVAVRLRHPVALDLAEAPAWQRLAARITHLAIYLILVVAPFLGWASASAHRLPVTFWGLANLPDLAAPRARWALTAGDIHGYAMWTLLGLVGLHVAAVLFHHFVRRDGVLGRMLGSPR